MDTVVLLLVHRELDVQVNLSRRWNVGSSKPVRESGGNRAWALARRRGLDGSRQVLDQRPASDTRTTIGDAVCLSCLRTEDLSLIRSNPRVPMSEYDDRDPRILFGQDRVDHLIPAASAVERVVDAGGNARGPLARGDQYLAHPLRIDVQPDRVP